MSIQMHYDRKKEILYCYFDKTLSVEEVESTLFAITHGAEYLPDVDTLWDMGKIDFSEVDEGFIKRIISMRQKFPERGNAKVALIVSSDLGFGLSRMYETFSEAAEMSQNINVFRDRAKAEKWLLDE